MILQSIKNINTDKTEYSAIIPLEEMRLLESALEQYANDNRYTETWSLWENVCRALAIRGTSDNMMFDKAKKLSEKIKEWENE